MEMQQGVWKQHLRPRAVVGYGLKFFLPSPPNYVTRSPGEEDAKPQLTLADHVFQTWGLFLKSPETFRAYISGDIISNFAFIFILFTTYEKTSFTE